MDIFKIHEDIITDYKEYIKSFISIKDETIRHVVDEKIKSGELWPDPLIQFNPAFEYGDSVHSLVNQGFLHHEMNDVFKDYRLFRHQVEAIKLGIGGSDFIVTSGTGSGKSLTYIGTIFNHLLANPAKKKGIKAIIVYPMNALINSQNEEIKKYKENYESSGKTFPISFAQYTGQEDETIRERIRNELPDIILTNYMMLELILTRNIERDIRNSIYNDLLFLVFDELHTYRGRQGADVGMLIRRIKAKADHNIVCIGTSATMITGGTLEDQRQKVAEVASTLFGAHFSPEAIINEYLVKSLKMENGQYTNQDVRSAVEKGIDVSGSEENLLINPLANWVENEIALTKKEDILVRQTPLTINYMADLLYKYCGCSVDKGKEELIKMFLWISRINEAKENQRESYLPYKIHQFISQTSTVYVTLEQGEKRQVVLDKGAYLGSDDNKLPLFPVVFSRVSGHEFICVTKDYSDNKLHKREFQEATEEDNEDKEYIDGYILVGENVWDPELDIMNLPQAWWKEDQQGNVKVIKEYQHRFPTEIYFNEQGYFSEKFEDRGAYPYKGWYMPVPLLFDPTSGMIFRGKTNENTKLTKLGSEGRSTSTTILTYLILKYLKANDFSFSDQKLLSFTDNRQDAALQSGHFNDFIDVIKLRSAICSALVNEPGNKLDYTTIAHAVFSSLNLEQEDYAARPSDFPGQQKDNEKAFKDLLMYRILYDLKRSWRVILPNLEQCALLKIGYKYLSETCAVESVWSSVPVFRDMDVPRREKEVYNILDYIRKHYAIYSNEYLKDQNVIDAKEKQIKEFIKEPWGLGREEHIDYPNVVALKPLKRQRGIFSQSIGSRSALGQHLKQLARESGYELKDDNYQDFIEVLFGVFENARWLRSEKARSADDDETTVYQLCIDIIEWEPGDKKTVEADYIKNRSYKELALAPNLFFQKLYSAEIDSLKYLRAEDHTGQLNSNDRKDRELKFGDGEIKALYCSPTMELGIDIKNLSVVHMRNVPPNPANYVQRSGRAGRNGQPALIFTFCSSFAPHDRHYFANSSNMVAGAVVPPRIDLGNEELLKSHLHSVYLAEKGIDKIRSSITELLEPDKLSTLPLNAETARELELTDGDRQSIAFVFSKVIDDFRWKSLISKPWFTDNWIEKTITRAPVEFDTALNRWRLLYRQAHELFDNAVAVKKSGLYKAGSPEKKKADRDERQAERQMDLLRNTGSHTSFSEFYPFRYLASEGFLPGYNFYRLPLRTYIPSGLSGAYISRPRFIALQEFGPHNVIYYNGAKYRIEQMLIQDINNSLRRAKTCTNSGYFLEDSEFNYECCPFTGESLSGGNHHVFEPIIEMSETRTEQRDRITCEEEERLRQGYTIETYFSVPGGIESIRRAVVKNDNDNFLNISYIPAARLVQVNKKWKNRREEGFSMGINSGQWKTGGTEPDASINPGAEERITIKLYTTDTADALYIEPIKALALSYDGRITLQYALKRAIENIYQVESAEIAVTPMGDEDNPNIFLYESAEGSLGILSQLVEDKNAFVEIVQEAYRLCRFDDEEYLDPASYDDLLSYYNQRDHESINRFAIKNALETLMGCSLYIPPQQSNRSYDEQYSYLIGKYDDRSSTELHFLEYLYKHNLRLPDDAQRVFDGIYVKPDFFYEPGIHVFCDGTPHDDPAVKEKDRKQREAIMNRGEEVLVYYYRDSMEEFVKRRPDIFKKVQ
ncbi:MAG TPA: DEAD/DEAH box helicase [Spirochaetota bacterium]|nr:DEAD/DEAH box helicase [Spirochaetota bacterium]HPR49524.1 DEAD/DEAH box helicase [Spirochaetota bacterium]